MRIISPFWRDRPVLVTGGASFIGSHLVYRLRAIGAKVLVVDDLSKGRLENIADLLGRYVKFLNGDLRDVSVARRAVKGIDTVFHLAADHGGRGYIDLHQSGPASNLALDGIVFMEAVRAGVRKVVYASSGCVYPKGLQADISQELYLTEDLVGPPYEADNMYGWAKLMGEMTLKAYHAECGLKAAILRYFTVYGPRGCEDHAVIALIAKAFIRQDPFEVWGDGNQIRNWTYVSDIVEGTILAAEEIDDARAVNLGTTERTRVVDAARMAMEAVGHKAEISFRKDMPTGPVNRIASNALAGKLLGWKPEMSFEKGLWVTAHWYCRTHRREDVAKALDQLLLGEN